MSAPVHSAMVLAAGHGTRLLPLTRTRPKALVKVNGRALLDHQLDRLAAAGVRRAVVNVHHFASQVEAHLARRTGAPDIIISDERDLLLDTGGALVKARPHLGEAPFFVMNCDALWDDVQADPLCALQQRLQSAPAPAAVLLLARRSHALGLQTRGDFDCGPGDRLRRPHAGESVPYYYAGTQVLHPALLDGHEARPFSANVLWNEALAAGALFGRVLDGFWLHVGDPQALQAANERLGAQVRP